MARGDSLKGKREATQFGNGQPTNLGGRKKKIYNILKESGYGADDIRTAFGEIAWYSEQEVKDLLKKTDTPMIIRVVAKAYQKAVKDSNYSIIKEILEQFMGRALQKREITGKDGERFGIHVSHKTINTSVQDEESDEIQ